jgi:membrane associated rhomboid family serine protease
MFPLKDENKTQNISLVMIAIIIANVLVYIYQVYMAIGDVDIIRIFGLKPVIFINEPSFLHLSTIFASMFLHGGLFHLLGNMWFLWIFGNNVEDATGHWRFLIFYLLCGILSFLTHVVFNSHSYIPTIGASGAVSGIMGAYVILYPRARIVTLFPIFIFFQVIRVPAFFFLGFWFLYQFLASASSGSVSGSGVAWEAHVGGFIAGMVFIKLFSQRKRQLSWE